MTADDPATLDRDFAAAVVALLSGRRLATAESCTAGRISQAFAAAGDAERWFRGGVVAYQTDVKRSLLAVHAPSVLSEHAAAEMASGVADLLGAEVAVASTGLVGDQPEDGVSPGTVFIATTVDGTLTTRTHHLDGDPPAIVAAATRQALVDLLLDLAPPPTPVVGEPTS